MIANVTGASGTMGAREAKGAPPDGYTIYAVHDYIHSTYYTGVADVAYTDFEPICSVSNTPSVLTASPKTKWSTWPELLALVPIGPAFYPRILLGITAALSLALVITDVRRSRLGPPAAAPPTRYRLVLVTFAIFIGYVVLLPLVGYRIATFLFVGGLQAVLDPPRGRRWAYLGLGALATTVVTYFVFERYLSVLLPRGTWTGF